MLSKLDWYSTKVVSYLVSSILLLQTRLLRRIRIEVAPLHVPVSNFVVIAANHQTKLDPFIIMQALPHKMLWQAPVKFMTWHKFFNTWQKPFLYALGCFPSHGEGNTGVRGAVHYAKRGYRTFIFPEGKRTKIDQRGPAYRGVSEILKELPDARLMLAYINWEPRKKLLSRPKVQIGWFEAPDDLDRSNPDAIMNYIYDHGAELFGSNR